MKEVMSKYAQSKGVKADRLSWKRSDGFDGMCAKIDGFLTVDFNNE